MTATQVALNDAVHTAVAATLAAQPTATPTVTPLPTHTPTRRPAATPPATPRPTNTPTRLPRPTATFTATPRTAWYVAPSGSDFTSIQAAIDAVPAGATIYIRPGVYEEGLDITKEVHLIGEGVRTKIIIKAEGDSVVYFAAIK